MEAKKTKISNRLWQARRRIGLEQKQVAHLLGHKTSDRISRYERGASLPSLKTALKLAIIYRTSIGALFPALFREFETEIAERTQKQATSPATSSENPCVYLDALAQTKPSPEEVDGARKHAIRLHQTISETIERNRKFNSEEQQ